MSDEFHKRSSKSRKHTEKGITKHFVNRLTPEERKARALEARRRRAGRRERGPRRHAWDVDDETPTRESMARTHERPVSRVGREARGAGPGQDGHEPDAAPPAPDARTARVVSIARDRVALAWTHGVVDAAPPASGEPLAVGDAVDFAARDGHVRVLAVHPRRSALERADPGNPHARRVIAANVDVVVLVLACARPVFKPGLVDRVLLALDGSGAGLVVVANKCDLLAGDDAARAAIEERLRPYPPLGVPALLASALTGEGRDALATLVRGRTAVFVGHSGVGKSSLLNLLDPDGRRRTRAGRDGDGKGRHTTTSSTLTELPDGTSVIDTPGVRAFGLGELDPRALRLAFPELVAHAGGCRFRDCTHLVEPGCAVRAAVEAGTVPRARWDAYVRIAASADG